MKVTAVKRNQCLDLSSFIRDDNGVQPLSVSSPTPFDFQRFNARYLCGGGALAQLKSIAWLDIWKNSINDSYHMGAAQLITQMQGFQEACTLLHKADITLSTLEAASNSLLIFEPERLKGIRDKDSWRGGYNNEKERIYFVENQQVPTLLNELFTFLNEQRDTANKTSLQVAAIAQKQLLNIHPFPEGNGRLGRALWQALAVNSVSSFLSPQLYRLTPSGRQDYGAFQSLQTRLCSDVMAHYFWSNALEWQTIKQLRVNSLVQQLHSKFASLLALRNLSSHENRLVKILWNQPILSCDYVAQLLGVPITDAFMVINNFCGIGLLQKLDTHFEVNRRPTALFVNRDIVDLWLAIEREVFMS